MGNLYRFVEPVVLLLLKEKGRAYGYELAGEVRANALTDAEVERGSLYRTLRQLEAAGNVASEWQTEHHGPARRVYRLTPQGERHLDEWVTVLGQVSTAMVRFIRQAERGSACRAGTQVDAAR
jgi:DNA-binding PadR family transcriptional regulator